jgi:exodeoxyribonuclease VII small subunit
MSKDVSAQAGEKMPPFEVQMKQLEALVSQLERGDMPLDDALKAFETGVQLVAACKAQLALAEVKVEKIMASHAQKDNGEFETEVFES